MITRAQLIKLLDYDPKTGVFTWRERRGCRAAGQIAGCLRRDGYVVLRVHNRIYLAHRLAWLYVTGKRPKEEIDHRNCVKHDNRFANLREATHSNNNGNVPLQRNNTSGLKGASWHKQKQCWRASITINGQWRHLGLFTTAEAAHAAYVNAAKDYHGQFVRCA